MIKDDERGAVLVTGSGRKRVGNVVAKHLASLGYDIALHYRSSRDEAAVTKGEIESLGVACDCFSADVSEESEVEQMITDVHCRFERIDALVTTAASWETAPLTEVSADDVLRSFRVNALGTFLCARAAGLLMCEQEQGGCIVTIGDWAIERPYLDHAPYFISKGSIPTMTRLLAVELSHRNPKVRVNCIHPGPVMFPPDAGEDERRDLVESTLTKSGELP